MRRERWKKCINKMLNQMIKSAEGSAGLLHKLTKPTAWRGGAQLLKREEEARLLDRCKAKRKEWANHWQCDESVQNMEDRPWKHKELKKLEEALPRLRECELEKVSRLYKASRWCWLPHRKPPGFDKKHEEKWWSYWKRWSRVGNGRNEPAQQYSS